MTYSDRLRNPKWQRKRLEILQRDDFTCKLCLDNGTELHVHHLEYNNNPWDITNDKLITLCIHCHSVVEFNKKGDIPEFPLKIVKYSSDSDYILCAAFIRMSDNSKVRILFLKYFEDRKCIEYLMAATDFVISDLLIELKPFLKTDG